MTYSDRFIKLAREETQFHAYRNGNKAFFFKQQFGEGEYIYKIGYVDPLKTPAEINTDVEKAKDWLAKGVQPTETVKSYLVKVGAMEQSAKPSAPKTNNKKKKS